MSPEGWASRFKKMKKEMLFRQMQALAALSCVQAQKLRRGRPNLAKLYSPASPYRSRGSLTITLRPSCVDILRRNTAWRAAKPAISFFQAEDGIRDLTVTGVQTCALPI